jgi:hypothetical protein
VQEGIVAGHSMYMTRTEYMTLVGLNMQNRCQTPGLILAIIIITPDIGIIRFFLASVILIIIYCNYAL